MRTPLRRRPAFRYSPLVAAFACAFGTQASLGATFTVTVGGDTPIVGQTTLREAITALNLACLSGPHTIAVGAGGPFVVNLSSPLPAIACDNTTIAGGNNLTVDGSGLFVGVCGIESNSPTTALKLTGLEVRNFNYGGAGRGICGRVDMQGNKVHGNTYGIVAGNDSVIGGPLATDRNYVYGNANYGIELAASATIENNWIGTADGITAVGNGTGIYGFSGATLVLKDNVISGNSARGALVYDYVTVSVSGNKFGTNASGTAALPNQYALDIYWTYGGTIDNNVFSGNMYGGLRLFDVDLDITNNRMGTNLSGTAAIPNGGTGLHVSRAIGTTTITGNTASGNSGYGIAVFNSTNVIVSGNKVGTTADGASPLGNSTGLVFEDMVGGSITGNVVSGNSGVGLDIFNATDIIVSSNLIGTNAAGTAGLANGFSGGILSCTQNMTIGNNVISSNGTYGGLILSGITNSSITGNKVGTTGDGLSALANNGIGIQVNSVGCYAPPIVLASDPDPGPKVAKVVGSNFFEDNIVAHNQGDGVKVSAGVGNVIRRGSIHSNSAKNINLDYYGGPLPNDIDPVGGTGGPNNRQNYPVVTSAVEDSGNTVVSFALNSIANTNFDIHFYSNTTPGVYAGQTYLGVMSVTTDVSGNASGVMSLAGSRTNVTTTATGTYGTSEFSPPAVPLVPAATVLPSSINFGNVIVGNTSPPQEVAFTSTGNGPYIIDSMQSAAAPPSCPGSGISLCTSGDFSCSTTCATGTPYSTQVPQAPACKITGITFHPMTTGAQSSTIYACDNTSAAPRAITLSGTGILMTLTASPSSHNFSAVPFGSQSVATVTVSNPSSNPSTTLGSPAIAAPFSLDPSTTCGPSMPSGSTCTFVVRYTPSSTTTQTGALNVPVANGNPINVPLQGIGTVPYSITPPLRDFGAQALNTTSAPQGFTLSNSSANPIPLGSMSATAPFAVSGHTCTGNQIPANGACDVSTVFSPTANGLVNGQLAVNVALSGAPQMTAGLKGTGGTATVVLPVSADLGTALVGGPDMTATVTLQNNGTVALAVSSIFANAPFSATHGCPTSLAAGASCPILVKHTPVAPGTFNGTLTVNTNSPSSPHTVALTATVQATQGVLSMPTGVDFGTSALAGPMMQRAVQLRNNGNGNIDFTSIAVTSPFQMSHDCPATLAPAATCTANLAFDPVIYGNTTGQLTVQSNASGAPHAATLLATVDRVTYGISPAAADFGSLPVGNTSPPRTFIISNNGDRAIPLAGVSTRGAYNLARTDCGPSIPARGSCSADVAFSPDQAGDNIGALVARVGLTGAPPAQSMLTGAGTQQAGLSLPDQVDFGTVALGSTASLTQTLELRNTGNAVLTFQLGIASGPFALSSNCGLNLRPGEACTVVLTFPVNEVGTFPGSLSVVSNAPGGSRSVRLIARVQPRPVPVIRIEPTVVGFGERIIGTPSQAQRVTVTNDGSVEATLGPLQVGRDFTIASQCGATLAPQASCVADVAFRPIGFGPRPATLEFSSNATGSPHRVDLLGTGCRPFGLARRPGQNPCSP